MTAPSFLRPSGVRGLTARSRRATYALLPSPAMQHQQQQATALQQLGVARLPPGGAHAEAVAAVREYMRSLPEAPPFRTEVRSCRFWRAVWTEFLVTSLLLVIGCGAGVRWSEARGGAEELKASLALGLTVAALVQCAGPISGCHLNPAVSVALLVTRVITPLRTLSYVLAQCLGALAGASILYALTPADVRRSGLSATVPHPGVHPSQAFGVEFLITLLVLVTLVATYATSASAPSSPQTDTCFKGLPIGVAYTVGHLFGYPYTGAGMNPARSLALAIVTNSWDHHWVYWVGPILGGIIGGITYDYIHDSSAPLAYRARQPPEVTSGSAAKTEANLSAVHETEMTLASNDCRV